MLWLVWIFPMILFTLPCGIPVLWLGTVWSLAIPALLFERLGPIKALGRSFRLIGGRFWASLLLIIIVLALIEVISLAIQYPLILVVDAVGNSNEIANAVATVVASLVSTSMTYPYMVAVLTILYFDQRVRKEGFDLQLLAQGLGVEPDPDASPLIPPPPAQQWSGGGWQPQPPQHWQPGGWTPPAPSEAGALRWGPATPPADDRPPEESPWMTPAPPGPPGEPPPRDATPEGDAAPLWRSEQGEASPAARRQSAPAGEADAPPKSGEAAPLPADRPESGGSPRPGDASRPPWATPSEGDRRDEGTTSGRRASGRAGRAGCDSCPRAGVLVLALLVAAPPARASEVSAAQLKALAARAVDDPAALAQLEQVNSVDGRAVDIRGALRGATGSALDARLRQLAATVPARTAPAARDPRQDARAVLAAGALPQRGGARTVPARHPLAREARAEPQAG